MSVHTRSLKAQTTNEKRMWKICDTPKTEDIILYILYATSFAHLLISLVKQNRSKFYSATERLKLSAMLIFKN